ncbi:hypothetical protein FTO70_14105 [Methanosarcina sp. KYL-1]|uniref:hypothetical protein n=1 Tax=Methanosarcina sp. KYL-1 TaxID=2602068 RepID=UPI0021016768|nr:hypothetical protein [Methanosarcina sp. KYL-1]MCQ1536784.1 hypothetical protein [Methanosarcina sp. KYL-1]
MDSPHVLFGNTIIDICLYRTKKWIKKSTKVKKRKKSRKVKKERKRAGRLKREKKSRKVKKREKNWLRAVLSLF